MWGGCWKNIIGPSLYLYLCRTWNNCVCFLCWSYEMSQVCACCKVNCVLIRSLCSFTSHAAFVLSLGAQSNPPFIDSVTHSTPQMVSLVLWGRWGLGSGSHGKAGGTCCPGRLVPRAESWQLSHRGMWAPDWLAPECPLRRESHWPASP